MNDRCDVLVPKQADRGPFECALSLDSHGKVVKAYVGTSESLPHLTTLFFMKAAGLSFWTLGPLLVIGVLRVRGAFRGGAGARQPPAEASAEVYIRLAA
mmetsp:Transcript_60893/g.156955  ORF Transcript_60893/g.156955 Transcript_60893/m.156955 type:complete len:99 (+) Transcript_60893:199-495(+)